MRYLLARIDETTMYRVVLYVLGAWACWALTLSFGGYLYYSPREIIYSLVALGISGIATHYILKKVSGAPADVESTLISILILFFVFDPTANFKGLLALLAISFLAIASKYVFAWRRLHIANPVAVAIVLGSLLSIAYSTWWIGTPAFFLPVCIGGIIITRKVRRFSLVFATIAISFLSYATVQYINGTFSFEVVNTFFFSWPIIFFATVMVTEPLSTPRTAENRFLYAVLIGVLSAIPFEVGPFYNSLALTLVIANIVFYRTTLRSRPILTLRSVNRVARDTYEFIFSATPSINFSPGQYLELTLPHKHVDSRGVRRYFTIASAPEEHNVILGVKIYEPSSSYKKALMKLSPGSKISVTSLKGDFVLPDDPEAMPLVFIAGGVGVTPFRSMIKSLLLTQKKVNAVLFYFNNREEDIAWKEIWDEAKSIGLTTVYIVKDPSPSWRGETGYMTEQMFKKYVVDPEHARYYLSGSPAMIGAYSAFLKKVGILKHQIIKDYFSGLA